MEKWLWTIFHLPSIRPYTVLEIQRVRALFSFGPDPAPPPRPLQREVGFADLTSCSPQFADGHGSMLFELGRTGRCWVFLCPS
jgi:hypothetical protein